MLLQDLFDNLATGELSQHKFGSTGSIREADYPAIITQLNKGLTNLHSHTEIRLGSYTLVEEEGVTSYPIDDTAFLSIKEAFDVYGNSIGINDGNNNESWLMEDWATIMIPNPVAGRTAQVIYRAKHDKIEADASLDTVIAIPPYAEEALQAYIAGRCFVSLGNQASAGLASYYTQRYQEQLKMIESNNLLRVGDEDTNNKLSQKGFL